MEDKGDGKSAEEMECEFHALEQSRHAWKPKSLTEWANQKEMEGQRKR